MGLLGHLAVLGVEGRVLVKLMAGESQANITAPPPPPPKKNCKSSVCDNDISKSVVSKTVNST